MDEKISEILKKSNYDISDLIKIVEILRSPNGCPWDREQSHKSIRRDLLEEAYEVADAIDSDSDAALCEELGDLLLQVVFHAQIAAEEGKFNFSDAVDGVSKKMILRHPHVFGDVEADSTDEVLKNWDEIKRTEKSIKSPGEELDAVVHTMPSLMRAAKLAGKCKKMGIESGVAQSSSDEKTLGRELFSLAARAKELGLDPEKLLSDYCDELISGVKD